MNKLKLLIVEDDPNLGQILQEYLEIKGFDTHLATDGEMGFQSFNKQNFDLCLLDIMMPKLDGFSLAEQIRETDQQIPFIFLTAKNMKEDTLKGLKLGADDYITKPFSMEELMLRIQAVLRRTSNGMDSQDNEIYRFGANIFNYQERTIDINGSSKRLTSKEADLLQMLLLYKNKTLLRTEALLRIWGDDSYFNSRSMDVYITKLRKLLSSDSSVQIITEHGKGIRLYCDQNNR